MNNDIKTINKNIFNNKNLEENIPKFLSNMSIQYYTYGAIRLSLHYYTFYETYRDSHKDWGSEILDTVKEFNRLIVEDIDWESAVKDIDKLRNKIIKKMKSLIVFADIFANYEAVLNKVEYRFKKYEEIEDDDVFARDILRYIFDSQDNVIINEKIRDIIGQLPVRMTRQKYYDIIRGSFKHYIGAEWTSLQSYLYTIRTNAMLYKEENMEEENPWLWDQKEKISKISFKNLTKEEYYEIEAILEKATNILTRETEIYYFLQEMVNELYAMFLCKPYINEEVNYLKDQADAALYIIQGISELFNSEPDELADPSDDIIKKFSMIEGTQEELSYNITSLEEVLYQIDVDHRELTENLKKDKSLNGLLLSRDLLSSSLFIDFYEVKANEKVDENKLQVEADKLIDELSEFMNTHDRLLGRVVMANTLSSIPVFFKDHKEVMDYVRYSLEKCNDNAEKAACNILIKEMIKEY